MTYAGSCCRLGVGSSFSPPLPNSHSPGSLPLVSTQISIHQDLPGVVCVSILFHSGNRAPLEAHWLSVSLLSHSIEHSTELLAGIEYSPGESLRWAERDSGREKSSMGRATVFVSSWTLTTMVTISTMTNYQLAMSCHVLSWVLRMPYSFNPHKKLVSAITQGLQRSRKLAKVI